jgi:hypothetical protein
VPLSEPAAEKSNVSLLFAAPVRFSKSWKATLPTVPEPSPVTFHVESEGGPFSVSLPPPPSNVNEMPAPASDGPIVKLSLPSPPVMVTDVSPESAVDTTVPSIVSSRFDPATSAVTLWPEPFESVALSATGAGGASPLAVFWQGSGTVPLVCDGVVVDPAPDVDVGGAHCVPPADPVPEPDPVAPREVVADGSLGPAVTVVVPPGALVPLTVVVGGDDAPPLTVAVEEVPVVPVTVGVVVIVTEPSVEPSVPLDTVTVVVCGVEPLVVGAATDESAALFTVSDVELFDPVMVAVAEPFELSEPEIVTEVAPVVFDCVPPD